MITAAELQSVNPIDPHLSNLASAAAELPAAALPPFEIDFDGVPF